jgi:hypothetical protein
LSSFSLIDNQFNFSPVEAILIGCKISLQLTDNSTLNAVFDFL